MKVIISFFNHNYKNQLLSLFLHLNPTINDKSLTINGYIKIDYSTPKLNIYCYDLKTVDKILSEVCIIDNNVHFPNELETIMFNAEIIDFVKLTHYAQGGTLLHIDTTMYELQFEKQLCEWVYANISVKDNQAVITLKFTTIENKTNIEKQRIKQHPLIYCYVLKEYFKFNNELELPTYSKIYYYKHLYSNNGFKKYNKFLNEFPDYHYDGWSYTYHLKGGYIKFELNDLSISYPDVLEFKSYAVEDLKYIKDLNKYFNINSIQEITEVCNLNYSIAKLNEEGYIKNEDFFEYIKTEGKTKYIYDIYEDILKKIVNKEV